MNRENIQKNIYKQYYVQNNKSSLEIDFEDFIDELKEVCWWYKNGENNSNFFATYFEDETINDFPKSFYPDYIIKLNNEKIMILDTKVITQNREDIKQKLNSVKKWIKDNNLFESICTGIIAQENKTFYLYENTNLTNKNIFENYINKI